MDNRSEVFGALEAGTTGPRGCNAVGNGGAAAGRGSPVADAVWRGQRVRGTARVLRGIATSCKLPRWQTCVRCLSWWPCPLTEVLPLAATAFWMLREITIDKHFANFGPRHFPCGSDVQEALDSALLCRT